MLDFFLSLTNRGLLLGLILLAFCLLRPLLLRLLSPQQRAWVWTIGWVIGSQFWNGLPGVLPVTFQDLMVSRTDYLYGSTPAFLPPEYTGAGDYYLALTGGHLLPVHLTDWLMWALLLIWLAGIVFLIVHFSRQKKQVLAHAECRKLTSYDPLLRDQDVLPLQGMDVWLCRGLPTSFACYNMMEYQIYIQEELPPEQLDLVLRHEIAHVNLWHCYWKLLATVTLVLYWWNPFLWLAFRYFCRDLELACDAHVMKKLPPERRKEYARTLLELGSGRQLWAMPLSFGECDGALRVRAAALWKPRRWWKTVLTSFVVVAIFLFFFGGHIKPHSSADMLLAWERERGGVEYYKQDLGRALSLEFDRTPKQYAAEAEQLWTVEQVWEGEMDTTAKYPRSTLWVSTTDGSWYHVYYYWMGSTNHAGVTRAEKVEAPDLSGLERLL